MRPARRSRGCCARAMPVRTPSPITSSSSTRRSPSCRPRAGGPRRRRRLRPRGAPRRRAHRLGRLDGRLCRRPRRAQHRLHDRGGDERPDPGGHHGRRRHRAGLGAGALPGRHCERGSAVCELTELVELGSWPEGTRLIVRREPLHPGAQRSLFPSLEFRYWGFYTDQAGDPVDLDVIMRAHAHVENHIERLKDSGLCRFPFSDFEANANWMTAVMLAADLVRWFQLLCFEGYWQSARTEGAALGDLPRAWAHRLLGTTPDRPPPRRLAERRGDPRRLPTARAHHLSEPECVHRQRADPSRPNVGDLTRPPLTRRECGRQRAPDDPLNGRPPILWPESVVDADLYGCRE